MVDGRRRRGGRGGRRARGGRRHSGLARRGRRQVLGVLAAIVVPVQEDEGQDADEDDDKGGQPPLRTTPRRLRPRRDRGRHRRREQGVLGGRRQRGDRGGDHDGLARVGPRPLLERHRQRGDGHPEALLGPAQSLAELGRRGVALGRVLGHAPVDDGGQRRRDPRGAEVRGRLGQHPVHHGEGALVGRLHERRGPGEELVQGRRQAVDVAGGARRPALQRLGGGVGRRAGHHAAGRQVGAAFQPGDAEVRQDRLAEGRHQDVLRLDVPVQDAGAVGRFEGTRQLDPDVGHLGPWHRAPVPQAVAE